jgi:hypothetical protein
MGAAGTASPGPGSPTVTPTISQTPTSTPTITQVLSPTATYLTVMPSTTGTFDADTNTPTMTVSPSPTSYAGTPTSTFTISPSPSETPPSTPSWTPTSSPTTPGTPGPSVTASAGSPGGSPTDTATQTSTFTQTPTITLTFTSTSTQTPVQVVTASIPTGVSAVVSTSDGANIQLPIGSFSSPVVLTVQVYASNPAPAPSVTAFSVLGTTYEIDAGGATLQAPVTLTFPFNPLSIPMGQTASSLTVAYYNGVSWTALSGVVDTINNTISVQTTHFSIWAVVLKPQAPGTPSTLPAPAGKSGFFVIPAVHHGDDICARASKQLSSSDWDLYNIAGERVAHLAFSGPNGCLGTSHLAPGFYFLHAKSQFADGSSATDLKKIVIQP